MAKTQSNNTPADGATPVADGAAGAQAPAPAEKSKNTIITGSEDDSYEFNEKDNDYFHVRHARMEQLASGISVEDPGSVRFQMYRKEVFADQLLNKEKGLPSIWDAGETIKVLHNPTK